jgi:hypothetical protein
VAQARLSLIIITCSTFVLFFKNHNYVIFEIQIKYVLTINSIRTGNEFFTVAVYSVFVFLFGYLSRGRTRSQNTCNATVIRIREPEIDRKSLDLVTLI